MVGHVKDNIVQNIIKLLQNSEAKITKGNDVGHCTQEDNTVFVWINHPLISMLLVDLILIQEKIKDGMQGVFNSPRST